jgi:drug/metabolite transporter (DMT)-like permease
MTWLSVTILAYFLLAVVFLIDKYLLSKAIPNPKLYAFFIGISGILLLFIVPFINFVVPDVSQIILSFLAGISSVAALYWFFKALKDFEASRVVPAVGGLVPLFSFLLVYIFSLGKEKLSLFGIIAFVLLVVGSVLINFEKGKFITAKSLKLCLIASFLFALSFVLAKYVYLSQPFLSGLVWIRIGGVLMALTFFILFPGIKKEIFEQKNITQNKTTGIFIGNQIAGAGGVLLQNWAISLAPLAFVSIISALQGVQYAFLLIIIIFLSLKFPQIIREEIGRGVLLQKIFAILLISGGLFLLII